MRRKGWQASYKDTFSLDYTLSPIILAALKKFREQSHKDMFGYPSRLNTDFSLPENSTYYLEWFNRSYDLCFRYG